jgi:hypothetical protein
LRPYIFSQIISSQLNDKFGEAGFEKWNAAVLLDHHPQESPQVLPQPLERHVEVTAAPECATSVNKFRR